MQIKWQRWMALFYGTDRLTCVARICRHTRPDPRVWCAAKPPLVIGVGYDSAECQEISWIAEEKTVIVKSVEG